MTVCTSSTAVDFKMPSSNAKYMWAFAGVVAASVIGNVTTYFCTKMQVEGTAAAGYATLAQAQKELQMAFAAHVKEDEQHTADLATQVTLLKELVLSVHYTLHNGAKPASPEKHGSVVKPPPPLPAALGSYSPGGVRMFKQFNAENLPMSLDAAVRAQSEQRMVGAAHEVVPAAKK